HRDGRQSALGGPGRDPPGDPGGGTRGEGNRRPAGGDPGRRRHAAGGRYADRRRQGARDRAGDRGTEISVFGSPGGATGLEGDGCVTLLWEMGALVEATGGRPFGTMPQGVTGISIDSRTLKPGEAFFAIKGERFDGHDFATAAMAAGASILVVSEGKLPALGRLAIPKLVVPDVLGALRGLAAGARRR